MSDAVDLTDLCGACHNPSEGALICEDCETIALQGILHDARRHRRVLWRDRFLDTLEHGHMTREEMRRTIIEGSERVAYRRAHAF